MSEPKSRLEAVNPHDPGFAQVDRQPGWMRRLPMKLRMAFVLAPVLLLALSLDERLIGQRFPHEGWIRAGIVVVTLALGAGLSLFDHIAAKRRRAAKRAPASFE